MGNPLLDLIGSRLAASDARFAKADDERSRTSSAMLVSSARFANVLLSLGVKPGDRVAVQVKDSLEALMLYLGTMRAGGIFVPLHTAYTAAEIEYFLNDSHPAVIVCDPSKKASLKPLAKNAGAKLETLGARHPWSRSTATLFDKELLASRHFVDVERESDDIAAMLYAFGTTGLCNGEMLSYSKLLSDALALMDHWRFTKGDVLLHALPNLHTEDVFAATNVTLLAGATMILLPDYGTDWFFRHLPQATSAIGGPAFYGRLLKDARLNKKATKHMRLFLSGAEPLPSQIHREWKERTGHAIIRRYGLNEHHMNISKPREGDQLSEAVMSDEVVFPSAGRT
ncbi:hypothetical protein BOSEA31B_20422 [Hyphomicrobiales bacterium]|jgi:malonyl-CoA/methylmalonyl-CoA synthetase|nr:hypothetical protein BOSEA31B_20422 [Hyphomicrobiales bacterium]CAH1702202.1 hypothetical protein BOSEA1005_30074 [Hyphomicrobiales bacterium]CAI0346406.1 hypothetical protein BO1005MUT1_510047 [Hyphomicrobiales bacterium]